MSVKYYVDKCLMDKLCMEKCYYQYKKCLERCKRYKSLAMASEEAKTKLYLCVLDCDMKFIDCYEHLRILREPELLIRRI